MFGWLWWLVATGAALVVITLISMNTGQSVEAGFYFVCAAPLIAGGVAMAARRLGVGDRARAIVAAVAGTSVGVLPIVAVPVAQ